jgi:ubiquitin-protein ligase
MVPEQRQMLTPAAASALECRLIHDIADIQQDPYPNVHLHFADSNIRKACLILTPEGDAPLHLTIEFSAEYPLTPPTIRMQSSITHPNVTGEFVCASMLNGQERWTAAYTLRGVAIQMLSFFGSEQVEQCRYRHGRSVNLKEYRRKRGGTRGDPRIREDLVIRGKKAVYCCKASGFGPEWAPQKSEEKETDASNSHTSTDVAAPGPSQSKLFALPDKIVLLVFTWLETRNVLAFADAVPSIKTMLHSHDFIRTRELQCFCLKTSFMEAKLGIGVIVLNATRPISRSEFDMLSRDAFFTHNVRRSVRGVAFHAWFPLPLSRRHWNLVSRHTIASLDAQHAGAGMESNEPAHIDVLYHFMNTIVVQFSADADTSFHAADTRSTLSHASEKAIHAYFSLFHLLLCLATTAPAAPPTSYRLLMFLALFSRVARPAGHALTRFSTRTARRRRGPRRT